MSDVPPLQDTPHEVEAIIRTLPARLRPERVNDWGGVFHFEIKGANKPQWTVRVGEGTCLVEEGHLGEAVCTVRMSEKTFIGIETGQRNPVIAFVKGKVRVSNVGQMRRYDRAFRRLHQCWD